MAQLSIGIVGLPNVGKSTLFRALTSVAVPAENYPFCTIDPNVGVVRVPDPRLDRLAELIESDEVTPATVEFVDIAGLVEGASRGEGLGNRFLEQIRRVDAVAHVLRCFEDDRIVHPAGDVDPVRDLGVVETELALADLAVLEKRVESLEKGARHGGEDEKAELEVVRRVLERLERGEPARREPLQAEDRSRLRGYGLLTLKPTLYVPNVAESAFESDRPEETSPALRRLCAFLAEHDPEAPVIPVSARLEAEAAEFPEEERRELLRAHGLEASGLDRLVRAGFRLLGLIIFFTFNENELRAWTLSEGSTAPEAAGRVHSDFRERFIRAETVAFEEFERAGSMREARERGILRSEGKGYVVRDGDVLLFRTGA